MWIWSVLIPWAEVNMTRSVLCHQPSHIFMSVQLKGWCGQMGIKQHRCHCIGKRTLMPTGLKFRSLPGLFPMPHLSICQGPPSPSIKQLSAGEWEKQRTTINHSDVDSGGLLYLYACDGEKVRHFFFLPSKSYQGLKWHLQHPAFPIQKYLFISRDVTISKAYGIGVQASGYCRKVHGPQFVHFDRMWRSDRGGPAGNRNRYVCSEWSMCTLIRISSLNFFNWKMNAHSWRKPVSAHGWLLCLHSPQK